MSRNERIAIGVGVTLGLAIAFGVAFWQQSDGPNEQAVRRVVVTTIQKETPASFLITGTLQIQAEATVDSASTLTPQWFNELVRAASSDVGASVTSFAQVRDRVTVKVPGRVSYGFDVSTLKPSMIQVNGSRIEIDLPPLSVRGIEPDLEQLEIRTSQTGGWKRMFVDDAQALQDEVRAEALKQVKQAFREQADARIQRATQPRINTARAIETMLQPSRLAVGIPHPTFRMHVGDQLVLESDERRVPEPESDSGGEPTGDPSPSGPASGS
jgi:hypothetical protein